MKRVLVYFALFTFSLVEVTSEYIVEERFFSDNRKFYAETIRYSSSLNDIEGQTKVYNAENKDLVYKVDRFIDPYRTYLGNDGFSMITINYSLDSIICFHRGNTTKSFSISELLHCDEMIEDCDLYYSNPDLRIVENMEFYKTLKRNQKKLQGVRDTTVTGRNVYLYRPDADQNLVFADKIPIFSYNDTLFIITPELTVLRFCIRTGEYDSVNYYSIAEYLRSIGEFKKTDYKLYNYKYKRFPLLANGQNLIDTINTKFNFFFIDNYLLPEDSMMYYYISFRGLAGRNRRFEVAELECDSVLKREEVIKFIESLRFEELAMPPVVDKWLFSQSFYFRNKDSAIAKAEKLTADSLERIVYKRNLAADSIAGIYIPTDLNDCNRQLDLILPPKTLKEIDEMKSASDMIEFHFGLGMWMRNNWGLWIGSRLSEYFTKMDICHPDSMSGVILESYWHYRHKITFIIDKDSKP